jgi:hypothetical protein
MPSQPQFDTMPLQYVFGSARVMTLRPLFIPSLTALLAGCQPAGGDRFQGYAEGEPVLVPPSKAGS